MFRSELSAHCRRSRFGSPSSDEPASSSVQRSPTCCRTQRREGLPTGARSPLRERPGAPSCSRDARSREPRFRAQDDRPPDSLIRRLAADARLESLTLPASPAGRFRVGTGPWNALFAETPILGEAKVAPRPYTMWRIAVGLEPWRSCDSRADLGRQRFSHADDRVADPVAVAQQAAASGKTESSPYIRINSSARSTLISAPRLASAASVPLRRAVRARLLAASARGRRLALPFLVIGS